MHRDVKGLYGSRSAFGDIDPETTGVLVCTIEKANQLITRLLEDDLMGLLSCIVVDELHMVCWLLHDFKSIRSDQLKLRLVLSVLKI